MSGTITISYDGQSFILDNLNEQQVNDLTNGKYLIVQKCKSSKNSTKYLTVTVKWRFYWSQLEKYWSQLEIPLNKRVLIKI